MCAEVARLGGDFEAAEIAAGPYGLGLRTRRAVEALEVVASIPLSACAVASAARDEDAVARCASAFLESPNRAWRELVLEHTATRHLPLTWDEASFERRTRGLSIRSELRRRRETARAVAERDARLLVAQAHVASRAYWLSSDDLVLAPVLDFANHDADAAYVDAGDGVFARRDEVVLLASRPVPPHAELFATYLRDASRADFFANFGFVDPTADRAPLRLAYRRKTLSLDVLLRDATLLDDADSQLALADFVADLADKPLAATTRYFDALLDDIPQNDDDEPDDIAAAIAALRRDERRALGVLREHVIAARSPRDEGAAPPLTS
uniref:SET domain-containing protein n=1 Tax=Chrysocystis fragilis TaxID=1411660 RepID=A0A7S0XMA8_9STRA